MQTFDEVFTFDNLYKAAKKCCKGVRWKTSTKHFELHMVENVACLYNDLYENKYKSKGHYKFKLPPNRGKRRQISAAHISERCVQKCLCENYLEGTLEKSLIYDSAACLKGKGIDFSIKRLKKHLLKNRDKLYILKTDFSKYFDNINHEILFKMLDRKIKDKRILKLYKYFISLNGCKGLGLGSEISHITAMFYINYLDHYIKEKLRINGYGRYMDDAYFILDDLDMVKDVLNQVEIICNRLCITLNKKKTQIYKLEKGFIYLNKHITISNTNKINIWLKHETKARQNRRKRLIETKYGKDSDNYRVFYQTYIHVMKKKW